MIYTSVKFYSYNRRKPSYFRSCSYDVNSVLVVSFLTNGNKLKGKLIRPVFEDVSIHRKYGNSLCFLEFISNVILKKSCTWVNSEIYDFNFNSSSSTITIDHNSTIPASGLSDLQLYGLHRDSMRNLCSS